MEWTALSPQKSRLLLSCLSPIITILMTPPFHIWNGLTLLYQEVNFPIACDTVNESSNLTELILWGSSPLTVFLLVSFAGCHSSAQLWNCGIVLLLGQGSLFSLYTFFSYGISSNPMILIIYKMMTPKYDSHSTTFLTTPNNFNTLDLLIHVSLILLFISNLIYRQVYWPTLEYLESI